MADNEPTKDAPKPNRPPRVSASPARQPPAEVKPPTEEAKPKKSRTLNVHSSFGLINPANGDVTKYAVGVHTNVPDEHADHWMAKASSTEVE